VSRGGATTQPVPQTEHARLAADRGRGAVPDRARTTGGGSWAWCRSTGEQTYTVHIYCGLSERELTRATAVITGGPDQGTRNNYRRCLVFYVPILLKFCMDHVLWKSIGAQQLQLILRLFTIR